jgi:hypothetical protein
MQNLTDLVFLFYKLHVYIFNVLLYVHYLLSLNTVHNFNIFHFVVITLFGYAIPWLSTINIFFFASTVNI